MTNSSSLMPKENCAINTVIVFEYLKKYHAFSQSDLLALVEEVNSRIPSQVTDLETGKQSEITLEQLCDERYWISNLYTTTVYSRLEELISDPDLAYKIGLHSIELSRVRRSALGVALVGIDYVLRQIVTQMMKWARSKLVEIERLSLGHFKVRLIHHPGIIVSRFAMELHKGVFEAYARLAGYRDVVVNYSRVDVSDQEVYEFDLRFTHAGVLRRLGVYLQSRLPFVRQLMRDRDRAIKESDRLQLEMKEQIIVLEKTVEQRTQEYREQKDRAEQALLELGATQAQLLEEEKTRRIFQVRAAQADAVARFLHQTSNLVLQPLASMIIVFEDFIDIIEDYREEMEKVALNEEMIREFSESLDRVKQTYPPASRVITGYRELFRAFYEIYVSTDPLRDINQDLRNIQALVHNKFILTSVEVSLKLDEQVPALELQGGIQSILLELMYFTASLGAQRILAETIYDKGDSLVHVLLYSNADQTEDLPWGVDLDKETHRDPQKFGLSDARYIIEQINRGRLSVLPSTVEGFSTLISVELPGDNVGVPALKERRGKATLRETLAALSAEVGDLQRDRKALTEQAQDLAGRLVEAEKLAAVGRLSFGVGHDLRNALATAINSGIPQKRLLSDFETIAAMFQAAKPAAEIAQHIENRKIGQRLERAALQYETMMRSLSQALENVRALEGYAVQDTSDFQEVIVEEVVERVLRDAHSALEGIRLKTDFADKRHAVAGNPLKLYDIFQNLITNAVEAVADADRPLIGITTRIIADVHTTSVEDNGHGMTEVEMHRAFEPFYTTKDLASGRQRGLGLFNVWRLVEQHKGKVAIESEAGEYTRVIVRLDKVA